MRFFNTQNYQKYLNRGTVLYYNYYRKRGLMEIKCVVEKIDRDVNEIMNLKYPYLPEKYFKKYLENEDKFSKLGIIINDYLEKILIGATK